MRLEPEYRCANWKDCQTRQLYACQRCDWDGRRCPHLKITFQQAGAELEILTKLRSWGTSLGMVIPKRTVDRLNLRKGDEIRVLISKSRSVASQPVSRIIPVSLLHNEGAAVKKRGRPPKPPEETE
jgi:antitoxin component of MazEF toxin-antitoxin module